MPRAKGGPRAGAPGVAYPNRSDLNANRSLPVRTMPGQTYGAAIQQRNAQSQVPMGAPPVPIGGSAPPPAPSAPPSAGPPGQPSPFIPPGALGSLERPSERPDEPVTHGAALGAGPGPESLGLGGPATGGAMTQLLNRAAIASGSSALATLAAQVAAQGR